VKSNDPKIKAKELLERVEELQSDIEKKENQIKKLHQLSQAYSLDNEKHIEIEKISKVGIWKIFLPDLNAEWSDELYNIFEIDKTEEELDYKTFLEYIHPGDRAKVQKELELAVIDKKIINIKNRIITPSGSIKMLHLKGKAYYAKNDHPTEILGVTQDITELLEIEKTRWESEENFSSIFIKSPSPLAITSIKDGKIIEVNAAFCELIDLQKKELMSKSTIDLNLWTDKKTRNNFIQILRYNRSVRNFESMLHTRDGNQKWVLLSSEIIKFNNEESMLTSVTDITEERESENKIKILNRTLKTISEINQLIVRETDKHKVLSETCRILVEHGKFSMAWIGLVDENRNIIPKAEFGFPSGFLSEMKFNLKGDETQKSLMAMAIIKAEEIICHDIHKSNQDKFFKKNAELLGINAYAAFPLIVDGNVIGAINISQIDGTEFSNDIIDLMKELAGDISLSLKLMKESEERKKAQADLKIRENHLSVIFNNNSDLQLLLSVHSNDKFIIEEVNNTFLSKMKSVFTNLKLEDLLGKNLKEVSLNTMGFSQDVWEYTLKYYKEAVNSGKLINYEESFDFEDFPYHSEVTIVPVKDQYGKCNYVLWSSKEITERKESEKLLKLADIVIQNSPAILFRWKATEAWSVEYVSKNISQFGYTPTEFLSGEVPYASIIHPDDIAKVVDEVNKYINDGSVNFRQEYRIITKDKRVVWTDDRTMIERDENGKAEYFQGVVIDITEQKIIESALWETQQMLSLVLDNIPQRIFWKDTNFNYLGCNKHFAKDAGLEFPDQILGKNDFELSWKDVAHLYRADDKEVIEKQVTKINYEEPQLRGDGSKIWLRTSKLPLKDKDGEILGVLGCYEDITERKLYEKALSESEKRFRNFVNQTSDGFYILTTNTPINLKKSLDEQLTDSYESFYIKECNDIFAQMYGYSSSAKMLNVALEEIHGNWDIKQNIETFKKFLSTGLKVNNAKSIEYDKNNNKKYFINNFIGIVEDNLLKEIWGTQQDITLRKESELALINSEEKFRSVFTDSHDCIYVITSDGKIINMNSAGLKLFNIPPLEIQKYNVTDFYIDPGERKKFQHDIIKKGFVKDYPVKLKTADNKQLDCILTASIRKDDSGSIISYQGILRDISQEKRAQQELISAKEQAEKADRLKTEFLAQMSHEIRTPINTILSFSSLIKEETQKHTNAQLDEFFNYQINAGKRIIRTIDLILNMSEIQVGSFQTNIRKLDIVKIINEIFKEYSGISKEKGLDLILSVTEKNINIKGDEYSIRQIFSNLIDNSIKYTNKGSIEFVVNTTSEKVVVEVNDTGIGIAKNYIEELFRPFSQEEQGYSRKFEGSGLGLALVKKYCDINNAEINVNSIKNAGTTFSVSFNTFK